MLIVCVIYVGPLLSLKEKETKNPSILVLLYIKKILVYPTSVIAEEFSKERNQGIWANQKLFNSKSSDTKVLIS